MANTGFKIGGSDLAQIYLTNETLADFYPNLAPTGGAKLYIAGITAPALGTNSQPVANTYTNMQQLGTDVNWKQVALGYDSVGGNYSAAIKTDGTLWLWGSNNNGQLGDSTVVSKSSPVQTVAGGTNWKQVALGGGVSAAVKKDGTLWTWGVNTYGQLGDGTITSKSSPVQTISATTSWKQVSVGMNTMAAIKNDGTLWNWGYNGWGQLGNGVNTLNTSSPIQTVAGGTNWKWVSAGGNSTSAIKTDGTLWSWGFNANGQLGDNTFVPKSSPVQTIAGGTNWKSVNALTGNAIRAIKTDGTMWAWGTNNVGQLGLGDTLDKNSPVQLTSGGNNWYKLGMCQYGVGMLNTGEVVLWGYIRAKAFYTQSYADSTLLSGTFTHADAYTSRTATQFAGRFWRDVVTDASTNIFLGIVDNSFTTN